VPSADPGGVMQLANPFAGMLTDPAARSGSIGGGGAVAWMSIMGIPQGGDGIEAYKTLESFARAPADEAWVYACVAKRFEAAASVPLRVYVKRGKELIPVEDEPSAEGDALQQLLDTINGRDMTGAEFRGYNAASRTVWGGCGWKKVRGRLLRDTQELYWLRAPDLTPKSENGRWVDTWDYHPNKGQAEAIKPEDALIFRSFNMHSQIDFLSPLSGARYDMVTNTAASQHTAAVLNNRAVPEGYWTNAKNVDLGKQDQSAIRRFIRQLRGPRNAGKALIAPDIEFHALGLSPKDAEWLAARKVSRMTVSAVTGVPLLVAGDDDKASVYANFRDADVAFWKNTNVPTLNADADVINNWLVPEFDPSRKRLVVAYDYSGVEALKPTWTDEWTGWLSGIDHQAITPNAFIRHFRLGTDVPWGDQPVPRTTITLRDTPTTPIAIPATSGEEAPPPAGEVIDAGEPAPDPADVAGVLRSWGKNLYRHPAVRAFKDHGGPLDVDGLIGGRVPLETRQVIERGLTARRSAGQIADDLREGVPV
jgi:phage portal protein BeeE